MAHQQQATPEKVGAGLLICCQRTGEALLLLRNSKHNDNTWGLPGGNVDPGEQLLAAAKREAVEELGHLPASLTIHDPADQGQQRLLIRRGKQGQKHFTVFLATVSDADRASYVPSLNHEHRAWRWHKLEELTLLGPSQNATPLHPVVELLVGQEHHRKHLEQLMLTAWGTCASGTR